MPQGKHMLILYNASPSASSQIDIDWSDQLFIDDALQQTMSRLLLERGHEIAASIVTRLNFVGYVATNDFMDEFAVLVCRRQTTDYQFWYQTMKRDNPRREDFKQAFKAIANVTEELLHNKVHIRFIVCIHDSGEEQANPNWRQEFQSQTSNVTNQALFDFSKGTKYQKYDLNFRSKTEIKLFEALVKQNLFVLPLPVAVLGKTFKKREPDFVIAYKGKIGILEIHGEPWHPPERSTVESDRRRMMRDLGVTVYEVFDANECWQDPDSVVQRFLKAFS